MVSEILYQTPPVDKENEPTCTGKTHRTMSKVKNEWVPIQNWVIIYRLIEEDLSRRKPISCTDYFFQRENHNKNRSLNYSE